jgi:hypothetical protein
MKNETLVLVYKIPAALIPLLFCLLAGIGGMDVFTDFGIPGFLFFAVLVFTVTKALLKPKLAQVRTMDHIAFAINIFFLSIVIPFLAGMILSG